MIICICANLNEQSLRKALQQAPLEEVMLQMNAGMQCGQCFKQLLKLEESVIPFAVKEERSS